MYHLIYDYNDADFRYIIASEDDTYLTRWYSSIIELFENIDNNIANPATDAPFSEWQKSWRTLKILISFPELLTLEQIQDQYPELFV